MEVENENNVYVNKDQEIYNKYEELDKLRKIIENLSNLHQLEIAKIFKLNNIKLTENNNGIFINLNNIPDNVIKEIKQYINFITSQEKLINIDESKKESLENIFFKDKINLSEKE